jgi:hypothetical protein
MSDYNATVSAMSKPTLVTVFYVTNPLDPIGLWLPPTEANIALNYQKHFKEFNALNDLQPILTDLSAALIVSETDLSRPLIVSETDLSPELIVNETDLSRPHKTNLSTALNVSETDLSRQHETDLSTAPNVNETDLSRPHETDLSTALNVSETDLSETLIENPNYKRVCVACSIPTCSDPTDLSEALIENPKCKRVCVACSTPTCSDPTNRINTLQLRRVMIVRRDCGCKLRHAGI